MSQPGMRGPKCDLVGQFRTVPQLEKEFGVLLRT